MTDSDTGKKAQRALEAVYHLKRGYTAAFQGQTEQVALRDLANFCKANAETYHPDARINAYNEGRRSVWLRVQQMLNLSLDELVKLYSGGQIIMRTEKDDGGSSE